MLVAMYCRLQGGLLLSSLQLVSDTFELNYSHHNFSSQGVFTPRGYCLAYGTVEVVGEARMNRLRQTGELLCKCFPLGTPWGTRRVVSLSLSLSFNLHYAHHY